MAIPHNTLQDAARVTINQQIVDFFKGGGTIEPLPAYDEPKVTDISGDTRRVYGFIKDYEKANKITPTPKRISMQLGITLEVVSGCLMLLKNKGYIECTKAGVISKVK